MKMYTIIGGVNGVGKSSFIGALKELTTTLGIIIDTGKISTGDETLVNKIRECIDRNVSFSQETTLSEYIAEAAAKEAKKLGYYVRMFYIGLDTVDESLQRIENRVKRGGHNIPQDDVTRRFNERWDAVAKVLPYCDEAEFYDNDNGFVKVAEYRNGEFRRIGSNTCTWADELGAYLK